MKFTKPVWKKGIFLTIGLLLFIFIGGCDGYDMEDYCNEEFSFIWKTEYQIKLGLTDNFIYNRLAYCQTTFEAWITRYPKFMFYFEDVNLDCDEGHLEFYVGESNNTRLSESCPSYGHVCANSRCIDGDIACNGYDSCGDGSGCDLGTAAIVGIVIGCVVGLALIISVVICCICCMKRSKITTGTVQSTPTTYPGYTQQVYSQSINGVNQGSLHNPSLSPYPVATATGIVATGSNETIRSIYGFNQGTNNQAPYPKI